MEDQGLAAFGGHEVGADMVIGADESLATAAEDAAAEEEAAAAQGRSNN